MPNSWGRVNWGAPTWSPRGDLLAFAGASPSQGWLGIFRATPTGRFLRPVALVKIRNTFNWFPGYVTWAPHGSKIVWALQNGRPGPLPALYISDARRLGMRRIVRHGVEPAWAPDGREIAYAAAVGIHLVRPDGRGDHRLTSGRLDDSPSWSPDGRYLAFARTPTSAPAAPSVYVIRKDGSGLRQLTAGPGTTPVWSPDGRQIAYNIGDGKGGVVIHVVNVDGTGDRALTTSAEAVAQRWSPNGQLLVFHRIVADALEEDPSIAVITRDGSGGERFVAQTGYSTHPSWSPDGTRIAYSGELPRCFAGFVVSARGGRSRQVAPCRYAGP